MFRTGAASYLLMAYMRLTGLSYASITLKPLVQHIISDPTGYEVGKRKEGERAEATTSNF
jgi:hypothetical protein